MDKKIKILLLCITLLGLYFRIKGVLGGYFAFTYDQGRDMLAVYDLVINHKFSLIGPTTGLAGIFYGPWWYWFMAPFFAISGGDPKIILLAVVLVNTSMIPIIFFLGRELWNKEIGVCLSIMVAFVPFFISSSVQLWSPNLVPFFTLLSLFLLWRTIKNKKLTTFFLLGTTLGLIQEGEVAYGVIYTIGVISALLYLKFIIKEKIQAKGLFTLLSGFILVILPRLLFDLRHKFLIFQSTVDYLLKPKIYQVKLSLAERFISRIESFFSLFSKTAAAENKLIALVIALFSATLLIRYVYSVNNQNSRVNHFIKAILVLLLLFFSIFIIYPDALWEYYIIGLPIVYLILIGATLFSIKKFYPSIFIPYSILLILVSTSPLRLIQSYNTYWEGNESVYRNQIEVVNWIYQDADKHNFSVEVYTPSLIDYPYQYLFLWYGKKKFGYLPVNDNKLVYYILEGPKDGWGRTRFLKDREGDGNIVSEKIVQAGITVQKRQRT